MTSASMIYAVQTPSKWRYIQPDASMKCCSWRHCFFFVDYCYPDPCHRNGDCTRHVNGYTCACDVGYGGSDCEIGAWQTQCGISRKSASSSSSFLSTCDLYTVHTDSVKKKRKHSFRCLAGLVNMTSVSGLLFTVCFIITQDVSSKSHNAAHDVIDSCRLL